MKTIKVEIEPYFAGDYRLEYDGKYVTLFGKDKEYPGFRFNETDPVWYEEMVLVSCVLEARNINPQITKVTDKHIYIEY